MGNTSTITVRILGNAKDAISEVGKFGSALGGLGKLGLAAGAGLATVGAGAAVGLFKIGNDFDKVGSIITKGTGATGDALTALMTEAKDVLATVPESGAIVGSALADVNTFFGQTGDQLEQSTKGFLDFARVHEVDLTKAISGSDAILTQFGEGAGNVDEVLGDLTRISQATGAPMDKMLGQMETFGPIFSNANFSIEETAAIFGQLEQAGVDMSRVGPAINKFFRTAAESGAEPKEALADMVTQIEGASSASEALNLATGAFGSEGAQRMVSAIRSGNFDLEDFNGLLGEGAGLVDEQAKATASFGDKWSIIKNKVLVGLEPLASAVFDGISVAMDKLGPYLDEFSVWFNDQLPGWMAGAQRLLETWGPRIVAVFQNIVGFVQAVWPGLQTLILGVFEAVSGFLTEYWPPTRELILSVFRAVVGWLEENWPTIWGVISQVLSAVQATIGAFITVVRFLWDQFGVDILRIINIVWGAIGPIIKGVVDVVTGIIGVFTNAIKGDWGAVWGSLKQIFSGAWAVAQAVITGAFRTLKVLLGAIMRSIGRVIAATWSTVVSTVAGLGGRITSAASGLFDGVKNAFKSAVNFIIDGWNGISFAIPGFSIGPVGFDGFNLSLPNIPRLATGGILTSPTLFVGGDNPSAFRDPEIVAPRSMMVDAFKEALNEVGADGGGRGGINIENVNVVERPLLEELAELELLDVA